MISQRLIFMWESVSRKAFKNEIFLALKDLAILIDCLTSMRNIRTYRCEHTITYKKKALAIFKSFLSM